MKIKSVEVKTIIIINGYEHERHTADWTESILDAKNNGVTFERLQDVFEWIETE